MIAFCSDKGSPGTTTAALAVAATWPEPAIVVEADPYGGDLSLRVTRKGGALADLETVLTVATAARTSGDAQLVVRYAQPINDQVAVVPGPVPAELASVVPGWEPLASALRRSAHPVLVDLGRVHAGSPVMPVAAAADVLVVVCRGEAASVIRLRERLTRLMPSLASLRGSPSRFFPVVVTRSRYGAADVEDVQAALVDTPAGPFLAGVGFVALDESAVRRLEAGEDPHGRLARTALLKSASRVAEQLTEAVPTHSDSSAHASGVVNGSVDRIVTSSRRRAGSVESDGVNDAIPRQGGGAAATSNGHVARGGRSARLGPSGHGGDE